MTRLMKYHTIMANPEYYWENNQVAHQLLKKKLTTHQEYRDACSSAGCMVYTEAVYTDHMNDVQHN